jgi:hypothetical protein
MENTQPNKELEDECAFETFIIAKFAETFKMDQPTAVKYLDKYGGLDYIINNWWALHIDNPDIVTDEILEVCQNNGAPK